jgi:hypothetical protein
MPEIGTEFFASEHAVRVVCRLSLNTHLYKVLEKILEEFFTQLHS